MLKNFTGNNKFNSKEKDVSSRVNFKRNKWLVVYVPDRVYVAAARPSSSGGSKHNLNHHRFYKLLLRYCSFGEWM